MDEPIRRNRAQRARIELDVLTHLTDKPFRGSDAVADGRLTRGRLRGSEFVPLFRDVYLGSSVLIDIDVRVRAVALRAGPKAIVAGPLAALAWEVDCPWDDAEAVVPSDRRFIGEKITARQDRLEPWEVGHCCGVALTSPARTAFDLARRDGALPDRVAAVDALAHGHLFGVPAIREVADAHPWVRGIVAVRRVLELVDPRAESLMETRMRLVFVLSGLPAPVPQYPVVLPNGRRVRLDLAWPSARVAVEYDGEDHRTSSRHADDLDRDAGLDDLDWDITHVTGRQIYRSSDQLRRRIALKLGL